MATFLEKNLIGSMICKHPSGGIFRIMNFLQE
uniref:Uncharacterized protein n=1 Tax=Podoviridae sp. ct8Lf7 TaxID=2827723 RepID=A0A8S5S0V5_9CAUD|nr:MAG TPA: hypothetical protein [Podoviridae sp. ct8Lf7]